MLNISKNKQLLFILFSLLIVISSIFVMAKRDSDYKEYNQLIRNQAYVAMERILKDSRENIDAKVNVPNEELGILDEHRNTKVTYRREGYNLLRNNEVIATNIVGLHFFENNEVIEVSIRAGNGKQNDYVLMSIAKPGTNLFQGKLAN